MDPPGECERPDALDDDATRYADVLWHLPDSVYVVDATGTITFVNRRIQKASGLPAAEVVGQHFSALGAFAVDPEQFEAVARGIRALLDGERTEELWMELTVDSPTMGTFDTEVRVSPLERDDAPGNGVVVVMRDVTDRMAAEQTLLERSEQLAVLNRLLRHDIRNDLNVVLGWGEELRDHVETAPGREALERVLDTARHSLELTEEARDLVTALEEGDAMPHQVVDLGAKLRQEVEKTRRRYPEATLVAPGSFPASPVRANELLGSVFGNLLNNAVIHNDTDEPRIEVGVTVEGGRVVATIADNGPGIPDARKAELFERESRLSDTSGTGMGLYLVQYLVEEYGGTVSVADRDPRGAVFSVDLPLADGEAD
ncbi:MAG: sensor histidine kinase [Haloarculaceae archaeon]